jgi:hypothetical protein
MALFVFPNKGTYEKEIIINKKKIATEENIHCRPLYQALGKDVIDKFRDVFDENNASTVKTFFKSDIV